jgi:hypothetical protein
MTTVCIGANCLYGPRLGGHTWVYMNWALGARSNGCEVVWLEGVSPKTPPDEVAQLMQSLRANLEPFGLADTVVLCPWSEDPLQPDVEQISPSDRAYESDIFIDLVYDLPASVVSKFRRTALINIDPGLLETWMAGGAISVADHDAYFTIGGRPFDTHWDWRHTRPCVALDQWTVADAAGEAPFTAVTGWYGNEWIEENGETVRNDKRSGFLPFLDVPKQTRRTLELALDLQDDPDGQRTMLTDRGWRVVDATKVSPTPQTYRAYVQSSLGEFGCCKPVHALRQTGWISDRTVCYLASGKPAVIQDTGPHRALEEGRGVMRFSTPEEAVACLDKCASDYADYSRAARALAEDRFDARKVVGRVIEQVV